MVQKGSVEDSEHYRWIQEVESFEGRQEVPGKCIWMLEVSGGLKKCMKALGWCREARNVQKGVKFGNQEGGGKLQGRNPSGRRCKTQSILLHAVLGEPGCKLDNLW